jgi:hypothetical protein
MTVTWHQFLGEAFKRKAIYDVGLSLLLIPYAVTNYELNDLVKNRRLCSDGWAG